MGKRIAVILGHPDPAPTTLCHALAEAYVAGAEEGGHSATLIELGRLEFGLLGSAAAFHGDPLPESLRPVQEAIGGCEHLVIVYPLWLGGMPAKLKGMLEQSLRPGFAFRDWGGPSPKGALDCSARVIVTMGMPALAYRWWFGAHGLKSLERNILRFCGMGPVRDTLFGLVESRSDAARRRWLGKVRRLGRRAR